MANETAAELLSHPPWRCSSKAESGLGKTVWIMVAVFVGLTVIAYLATAATGLLHPID